MLLKNKIITTLSFIICIINSGCKKLVHIGEPVNTITSAEAFNNENTATSAVLGIYNSLDPLNLSFGNGEITLYCGLSSDELNFFDETDIYTMEFEKNTLDQTNYFITPFWTPAYSAVYRANAAIEGLEASSTISNKTKNQLLGEAKFLRGFCTFYLTNLFGDIPLITTTAWAQTASMGRTSQTKVYQQIIGDLNDAENLLPDDYSISGGARTRVNKWAASALLARTYLYIGKWDSAEYFSTSVINNTNTYKLSSDLNQVFKANSTEAIWQLETYNTYPYATIEGSRIIPYDSTVNPDFYLTKQLLASFETGDLRKIAWVDSSSYSGIYYYYPFKYKVRVGSQDNIVENYTVLRLAEQYLIRAEARAHQGNNLIGAEDDLNVIRMRSGLSATNPTNQTDLLTAVYHERQIELFSEWGHRWLDLKRTGQANSILKPIKSHWTDNAQLYPIPYSEIKLSPTLKQNPGY
ncbi:MAG TPA: RagB/SusD family nutrient uptake outer membrane protein [Patescibacteria group bacterium]